MKRRRICFVTGSRADYGLLRCVMGEVRRDPDLELQIIVTGMHLSPEFGLTYRAIEADDFTIDERVEMLISSDTAVGVAKSIGLGVQGCADAFARLLPDIVVLLGDRFEILAAAQAALVARVPIAHIAGGDSTEGAFDEAIRHSITKMAQLHFVTNSIAALRVKQMGENPANIHEVGSPGLDCIRQLQLLSAEDLSRELDCKLLKRNLLITFHPVTLSPTNSAVQLEELLAALDSLDGDVGLFFTGSNADTGGREISRQISAFAHDRANARLFNSLGQLRYLSLMSHVDAVVGNSSSGFYEAPSFGIATVNIGDRQKGRVAADSVINCEPIRANILAAVLEALGRDYSGVRNPYGDGHASERIVSVLKATADPQALLQKQFYVTESY